MKPREDKFSHYRIHGVDPGGSTGWVTITRIGKHVDVRHETRIAGELPAVEITVPGEYVVIEDPILGPGSYSTNVKMALLEAGRWDHWATTYGITTLWFPAASTKPAGRIAATMVPNIWASFGKHERDAVACALTGVLQIFGQTVFQETLEIIERTPSGCI